MGTIVTTWDIVIASLATNLGTTTTALAVNIIVVALATIDITAIAKAAIDIAIIVDWDIVAIEWAADTVIVIVLVKLVTICSIE